MNTFLVIGLFLIIIGFVLVLLSFATQPPGTSTEVKTGGVVMIGPFPIIFGSDRSMVLIAIVGAIALMALAIIMLRT
jgi:uncharacterized protein (TIGR00304 family)